MGVTVTVSTPNVLQNASLPDRKRVRFSDVVQNRSIPHADDMSDKVKAQVWWTREENMSIRSDARIITESIKAYERSYIHFIDAAYEKCVDESLLMDGRAFSKMLRSPEKLMQNMQGWMQSRVPGRGLEKYISTTHRDDRLETARRSRQVVLDMYEQRKHGRSLPTDDISIYYKEYCRSCTLYARVTAEADHYAASRYIPPSRLTTISSKPRKQTLSRSSSDETNKSKSGNKLKSSKSRKLHRTTSSSSRRSTYTDSDNVSVLTRGSSVRSLGERLIAI